MIAELCACILLSLPQSGGTGFDRAMELLRAGDFGAAWAAAESDTDPARRARARVYVRWQAGDLEGALAAAESGALEHPRDVWLAARVIDLAVVLRRTAIADHCALRFAGWAPALPEAERAPALAALELAQAPLGELRKAGEERDAALGRARAVVLIVAGLSILALGWLAIAPRRKQPDGAL